MLKLFIIYCAVFVITGVLANWIGWMQYVFLGVVTIGILYTLFMTGVGIYNKIKAK